jgi:hypothetical protein
MIPKKPAPDVIRGGYRFSEKIMLQQKACNRLMRQRAYRPLKFGTRRSAMALTPSLKSSVTRRRFCSSSS